MLKNKLLIRTFAWSWLIGMTLLGLWMNQFPHLIRHELEHSLQLWRDPFGRNVFTLTSIAFLRSLSEVAFVILTLLVVLIFLILLLSLMRNQLPRLERIFESAFDGFLDWLSSIPGLLVGLTVGYFYSNFLGLLIGGCAQLFPGMYRLLQGRLNFLTNQDFFKNTLALGANTPHLFFKYYLPLVSDTIRSFWPHWVYRLLLLNATFGFLGVGTYPEVETWGQLIFLSREYLIEAPWILIGSGVPLLFTIWSFHLLSSNRSR